MDINLFHNLNGENICFKALDPKDAHAMYAYVSDKDVKRFIGWRLMSTLEETREFLEELIRREEAGTHLYASIVEKSSGEVIGTAMIFGFDKEANHAEIGYVLHKEHWGKGYGTETVSLISDFAFEILMLRKLHARVVSGNFGSARILEKNGFELEGRFRDYYFIEANYYDGLFFGKFPSLTK